MTTIRAGLQLGIRATGRDQLRGVAADVDKISRAVRKARDEQGRYIKGTFSGPLMQNGSFFSGGGKGGGPGGGGFGPLASMPKWMQSGGKAGGGAMKFAAQADLAASNFERIGAAGRAALTKPIESFFSLEQAMARVSSKMDKLSTEDYARLKQAAITVGPAVGFSSKEAADGLGEMAAAGFSVDQQLSALQPVLQMAKAGELDVGRATAIAASTMSQFGLKAADTAHIGDVLVAAANASVISVDDLAETLKYVGPIAHTAGISLEDTAAMAATLGNAGIEASMAGTSLRATIAAFAKQTPKARKAMAEVGISAAQMSQGVHEPLKLLGLLGQKLAKADEAKKLKTLSDVFGAPAAPGAASLMEAISKVGEDGLTAIQRAQQATHNANGSLDRAAKILGGTGEAKLKLFRAQVEATAASLGEQLAPALLDGTAKAQVYLGEFQRWAQENPGTVSGLGEVAFGITGISLAAAAVTRAVGAAAPIWEGIKTGARLAEGAVLGVQKGLGAVEAQAGITRGALSTTFGVAGAAYGGYAFGQFLDEWIGKTFKLRGELLSTELALKAGEAQGSAANNAPNALDKLAVSLGGKAQTADQRAQRKGLPNLFDLAESLFGTKGGNAARSDLDAQMAAEAQARAVAKGGRMPGQRFNMEQDAAAMSGKLEVFVTDDRVRTKLSGNVGRLGEQEVR
jgi:TP901 family phage tail tape measure protein